MTAPVDEALPDRAAGINALARAHGIHLRGNPEINDLGLDFQVATAEDDSGTTWVLRIPRRPDVHLKIEREAKILRFIGPRIPVAVPDWRVATSELVAYPRLMDPTALVIDAGAGTGRLRAGSGAGATRGGDRR